MYSLYIFPTAHGAALTARLPLVIQGATRAAESYLSHLENVPDFFAAPAVPPPRAWRCAVAGRFEEHARSLLHEAALVRKASPALTARVDALVEAIGEQLVAHGTTQLVQAEYL